MLYLFCIWMEGLSPSTYHSGTLPAFKYYFVKPFSFLKYSNCCFPNGWGIKGRNAFHNPFFCQYFGALLAQALINICPFRSGLTGYGHSPILGGVLEEESVKEKSVWPFWLRLCYEDSAVQWCSGCSPALKSITSPMNDSHQPSNMWAGSFKSEGTDIANIINWLWFLLKGK